MELEEPLAKQRDGLFIHLLTVTLHITAACNGLRFLLAMIVLAVAFAGAMPGRATLPSSPTRTIARRTSCSKLPRVRPTGFPCSCLLLSRINNRGSTRNTSTAGTTYLARVGLIAIGLRRQPLLIHADSYIMGITCNKPRDFGDAMGPLSPTDFHVLMVLAEGPSYGYAIMKAVDEHSGGVVSPEAEESVRKEAAAALLEHGQQRMP